MLINLSEVITLDGNTKEYPVTLTMKTFCFGTKSYEVLHQEPFVLTVTNLGKRRLLIEGSIGLSLSIPCDRCLLGVPTKFILSLNRDIDMNQTEQERIENLDEQSCIIGYNLDADQLVSNELLVNLPMKVLCDDNCKGICNRCGANLNLETCDCDITELDPRMSVIRDIFKNTQH